MVSLDKSLLLKETIPFDFNNPPCVAEKLSLEMHELMVKLNGIGLAANQIGLPFSMFVIRTDPTLAMFNPRIVHQSEEVILLDEGCLSYPGLIVKIKRPKSVRVRYQDQFGSVTTKMFEGITARVVQHEMDHLNGKLFYNRASKYHRDKALKGYST